MVERCTVRGGEWGSIQSTAVSKLGQFCSPHFAYRCLSEETKSYWSLLSSIYARGSKRSHGGGGKCVTCCGLISHEPLQKCPSVSFVNHLPAHKRI